MSDTNHSDALFGPGPENAEPVRAKDATVRKLFRPECHRAGCAWVGAEHAAFAEANAERQAHLNQHILAASQAGQHQLGQIEAGA